MKYQSPVAQNLAKQQAACADRAELIELPSQHSVLADSDLQDCQSVMFAMGCFWGAERRFWQIKDVAFTAVGYSGGVTVNPSYQDVCSGLSGHTEVVKVWYRPEQVDFWALLQIFWQSHDPTQGMRQGNDQGSQYRSAIYYNNAEQAELIAKSQQMFQQQLDKKGLAKITTEIFAAEEFYPAELYHQQYLAKNPNGYCGLAGFGLEL